MLSSHLEKKHWFNVGVRFVTDVLLFGVAFLVAMQLRFQEAWWEEWWLKATIYWFGILIGSLVFASSIYICGLYHLQERWRSHLKRTFVLAILLVAATFIMMGASYLAVLSVMGRGVMLIGVVLSYIAVWLHHVALNHWRWHKPERVALIVGSQEDETDAQNLLATGGQEYLELAGVILDQGYKLEGDFPVLGTVGELGEITERERLDRILCTNRSVADPSLYRQFCQLRYLGAAVMPVIGIYEEFYQFCPVHLLSAEWLLDASTAPQLFYLRKIKRGFDVAVSFLGLLLLWPVLLLAMLAVKLTSRGPVFFRQTRLGRFGEPFTVVKLRTMTAGAETNGAEWSGKGDPRVTLIGRFLRRYRIDEIPQFFNVLRGDMSFVGPRPERPEFSAELSRQIPFFEERLLVRPGMTGWAQVNYPYGNSIDDARRKLEYELYYIKHMSLFLDLFILLDTIRIIVLGGSRRPAELPLAQPHSKAEVQP